MRKREPTPPTFMPMTLAGQARAYVVGPGGTQNIAVTIQADTDQPLAVVTPILPLASAAPEVFVGRDAQVDSLLEALSPADMARAVVFLVSGLGGIGKTTLARHAAAVAVERDWFPGGALFVDLQGYRPDQAVRPAHVFRPLLRALGVPDGEVPADVAQQATDYHRLLNDLAASGRNVLLVLDNAASGDQVRDLLPQARAHRILITTRDTLSLPTTRRLVLSVLAPTDSIALLDGVLHTQHPDDHRATDAAQLAHVCGHLPLALRIAAGILTDDPNLSPADLATDLAAARVDAFAHGDTALATVLAMSWERLHARNPRAAGLLWKVAFHPGPDFAADTVGAMIMMAPAEVAALLRTLQQAHLVQVTGTRWQMHDLVRRFLQDAITSDEHLDVRIAVLSRYTIVVQDAINHMASDPDKRAWLEAERVNLIAAVENAAEVQCTEILLFLGYYVSAYLHARRWFDECLTVVQTVLATDTRVDGKQLEGMQGYLHNMRGLALHGLHRSDEALAAFECAVSELQQSSDMHSEGAVWSNIGLVRITQGEHAAAAEAYGRTATLFEAAGHHAGAAGVLHNIGLNHFKKNEFVHAIAAFDRTVQLCENLTNHALHGKALINLGMSQASVGWTSEAVASLGKALMLSRKCGDKYQEGAVWLNLGICRQLDGQPDLALKHWHKARQIFTELGDQESVDRVDAAIADLPKMA